MRELLLAVLAPVFACRSAPERAPIDVEPGLPGSSSTATAIADSGLEVLDSAQDSPLDWDATVAAAVASARAVLDAADAPVRIEEDSFVLVGDGPRALSSRAAQMFHQALTALFNGRFERPPARPTIVLFFATRPRYLQFAPDASIGYFKRRSREIDVDVSGGPAFDSTAVHELVHSLVADDWGDQPPEVVNEGLASLYENPSFPAPGEIRGLRSGIRRGVLRMALGSPGDVAEMRVDRLLGMTDAEFKSSDPWIAARNEAWARYFLLWLEERGSLWTWYREFKTTRAGDPHGLDALGRVLSMSPEQMTASWVAWARKLG